MSNAWQMLISLYAIALIAGLACLPLEYARRHPWLSYVRGAAYWAIFLAVYVVVLMTAQATLRASGVRPLFTVDLSSLGAGLGSVANFIIAVGLAFVPAFLFDVAYYWLHRLQHAVPFLWRFHAVHHSIEELNAVNCSHHWTDGLLRVLLITVPMMLLISLRVPEILAIGIILGMWGQVVHANTSMSFGPFDRVFVSPRFHRVHHSLDKTHHDKNFAGVFPIIDMVFGTAHFPKAGETIKTGLADVHEPRSLIAYLLARRG